jgi:hypothetical protein
MNGLLAFIGFVSNATILAILVLMVLAGTVSAVLRIHDAGHDRRREEMGIKQVVVVFGREIPKGKAAMMLLCAVSAACGIALTAAGLEWVPPD